MLLILVLHDIDYSLCYINRYYTNNYFYLQTCVKDRAEGPNTLYEKELCCPVLSTDIIASAEEAILGKLRAILEPESRNMYPNVLRILLKVKIITRRKH